MDAEYLVTRALSATGKKTVYKSPGVVPDRRGEWPESAATDCSGFISWCLKISRKVDHPLYKQVNGGWFETTAVYQDVIKSVGYFDQLTTPRPGAILVYPDYRDTQNRLRQGHIGIVTQTNGAACIAGVDAVVHCSVGNSAQGDAVQETPPTPWRAHEKSVIGWYYDLL